MIRQRSLLARAYALHNAGNILHISQKAPGPQPWRYKGSGIKSSYLIKGVSRPLKFRLFISRFIILQGFFCRCTGFVKTADHQGIKQEKGSVTHQFQNFKVQGRAKDADHL